MNKRLENFIILFDFLFALYAVSFIILEFFFPCIIFDSGGDCFFPPSIVILTFASYIIVPLFIFLNIFLWKKEINKKNRRWITISANVLFILIILLIVYFIFWISLAQKLALALNSKQLCYIAEGKNACLRDLAIARRDPQLCQETTASFNCYYEIAVATKNISLCKNLGEYESYCLNAINSS